MKTETRNVLGIMWDSKKEIGLTQDCGFKYYPCREFVANQIGGI